MKKETSLQISAALGKIIAEDAPKIKYTSSDVENARKEITDGEFEELCALGLCDGDFEKYYVIREFCRSIDLGDIAEGDYILEIFKNAKKLDFGLYAENPYMKLNVKEKRYGDILLTYAEYDRGEIFQYDMPSFDGRLVTPKLGFFTQKIRFPALYHGNIPWVSVCPSEINSMAADIEKAHGRVLVLGLGLGYYPYMISAGSRATSITVVEIEPKIIRIFEENILPLFEKKDKIKIVCGDAVEYTAKVKPGEYDFVFADIWEGAVDGAPLYEKIKANEKRLPDTEFTYWIKDQLEAYLHDN